MKKPSCESFWRICQIFFAEVLASGLAHFFCFLVDVSIPNLTMVAGFLAGASVYLAIWCTFTTSGAQINPMVTLAVVLTRRISPLIAPVYLVGDFVGTLTAMGIAWSISPFKDQEPGTYGMTLPGNGVSALVATLTEAVSTFILLTVILASLDELRAREWRPEKGAPFPLAVMLALMINVVLTLPVSGASMNPTRSLAAAIIQNNFDRQWIYVAGPSLGTVLACAFYELVICPFASLRRTRYCLCSADFNRKSTYAQEDVGV
ncbi:aquaporin 4 [Echinococcus multilocularis]|uniref:Aquaporin 4 n=1 Tax=Echinococcus multilocularis TaxID=6211 RepID=A0A087VYR1_ECHMU|nr:aquaporin 4 [Echinococcus multilocularis]